MDKAPEHKRFKEGVEHLRPADGRSDAPEAAKETGSSEPKDRQPVTKEDREVGAEELEKSMDS